MKPCKYCDTPFKPINNKQQYCSPECAASANYDRAIARNRKQYTGTRAKEETYTCSNGLEVKNDILGYLMKWGESARY